MVDDGGMMIIIIRNPRRVFSGVGFLGVGLLVCCLVDFLSIPFFFPRMGRMGGKKLWERAWDDGLTGVFAYWERPLLLVWGSWNGSGKLVQWV
jgi:hypothetical protein